MVDQLARLPTISNDGKKTYGESLLPKIALICSVPG